MDIKKLIEEKQNQFKQERFIQFTSYELDKMDDNQALKIINHFHGHTLLKFPQTEIDFFEWLKLNDNPVWNDLWQGEEDLYKVSIDLLPHFIALRNGFPICDLDITNYYFTVKHIKPKGISEMERILDKTENNVKLKIDELLLFDLHLAATDLWHFAYKYKLPLIRLKKLISEMDYKGWIVHLSESSDLMRYVEV